MYSIILSRYNTFEYQAAISSYGFSQNSIY